MTFCFDCGREERVGMGTGSALFTSLGGSQRIFPILFCWGARKVNFQSLHSEGLIC